MRDKGALFVMLCSEIMTTDVDCISPQTTMREAACRMRDRNVGFLPVCDEFGRAVAAITDRDIVVRAVASGAPPTAKVETFMAGELVACRASDDVEHARELMESYRKSRVICTGVDGRVVGVISLADLAQVDDLIAAAALRRVSERTNDAPAASDTDASDRRDRIMLELSSPAFAEGGAIPQKYSADGQNLSPPLEWSGAPPETRSFALLCEDSDAPSGTFRHWLVANIDADRTCMPEGAGAQPSGCTVARNDFGHLAYDGPSPPRGDGPHHYHFKLAALDIAGVNTPTDGDAEQWWRKVEPHIVAEAETVGTYQR